VNAPEQPVQNFLIISVDLEFDEERIDLVKGFL
jgi:hypothetical protein